MLKLLLKLKHVKKTSVRCFESEILAHPTCEELEQRTARATEQELGRRCNPTNGPLFRLELGNIQDAEFLLNVTRCSK